ncbi:MAG: hypothetical protein RSD07_11365 [Angelakisella sp.]
MKQLILSDDEAMALRMYLLMTTNYRKDEETACASLALDTHEDGSPVYPNMEGNAHWWHKCGEAMDTICYKLSNAEKM